MFSFPASLIRRGLKRLGNGNCKPDRAFLAPIRQGDELANGSFAWIDDRNSGQGDSKYKNIWDGDTTNH